MKKTMIGLTTAVLLGLGFSAAPAAAFQPAHVAITKHSDVTTVRFHRRPICTVRTVVSRGFHGRRIVKRVRVCR